MFKNVVKQIMGCGLKLVHCFWNYTIYSSVLLFVNKIYSQWISLELKSNSGFIKTGLTLVGGKCITRIQQASAKLRNVFVKALLWC